MRKKYIFRLIYSLLSISVIFSLFINIKMNEISNELSSINAEIVELERSRANINVEYIKKYSFENIENLSKLNSYVRLRVNNLILDLQIPYKLYDIEEICPTVDPLAENVVIFVLDDGFFSVPVEEIITSHLSDYVDHKKRVQMRIDDLYNG